METACETLQSLLGHGKVLVPGSDRYAASLKSYFSPQASSARPICFVTPQTVADVSTLVKFLATSTSTTFAIRGAGHMWIPGSSSSSGGVTVDLRGLNSIDLNADHSVISVGAGSTWDLIYNKLDPLGLSVAGGRVAGVGNGLTLGGGLSYFGPAHGWTCQQAISFEVVLADGSVVRASAQENADLWKGLRGAGNNFGIVTRIDYKTFQQGQLWSSLVINPPNVIDRQAQVYAKLMSADVYDEKSSFLTGWAFSGAAGGSVAINQLIYTEADGTEQHPAFYSDVLEMPQIPGIGIPPVVAKMGTHAVNSVVLNAPQAARYYMATTTFVPTEAMIRETYAAFNASITAISAVKDIKWVVNLEPLPPQIYARGAADNCLGLQDRTGSLVVCLLCPAWSEAADDEQVHAAARALVDDIEARAKRLHVYDPYIYMGYAAPWQEVIASYGEESVARLRALRDRVDPQHVFTERVPGGFKIPS